MALCAGEVEISFVKSKKEDGIQKADLYIQVDDVKNLHLDLSKKNIEVSSLVHSDYGMWDFSIHDPWGHHLVFGEHIADDKATTTLSPQTSSKTYVFVTTKEGLRLDDLQPLMTYREDEGTTLIITAQEAEQYGLSYEKLWAKITLGYQSDLDMVGLTALFSRAMTQAHIPCNVVAAYYHDHLFVPYEDRDQAVDILSNLKM